MKNIKFLSLAIAFLAIIMGCDKDNDPLMPVEISIISKSGILEIHYTPNKIDTLTKKQGTMTINAPDGDALRIKRICPEKGVLEYTIKTPTQSWEAAMVNNGDENVHILPKY